jgi:hypothetical protein
MTISLLNMATAGYVFCLACERVTEGEDGPCGASVCGHCKSPRLEFRGPIFAAAPEPEPAQESGQ